jgi:acyl-CoA synthetase (AMP-forming)/AMP-acid ligase II
MSIVLPRSEVIFHSPLPPIDIPEMSITDLVLAHAARLRDKPALVDAASGRGLSYGELEAGIRAGAARLAATGFGRGSALAILMPNCPAYAIAFHAATLAGGAVTTINPGYTAREIHAQLLDAGAIRLVTVPALLDAARAAAEGTAVEAIEVIGDEGPSEIALQPTARPSFAVPDGVAALPYSSGTTGLSKGVMLTHRNLIANVLQVNQAISVGEPDVVMAVLPFFHIYGMQVMMNSGLSVGATLVTMPRFDLELFLRSHAQYRITATYVAPPIVVALAKHPMVAQFDLSSLRFMLSGAAPLSAATAAEAAARVGCPVVQGYGMTELSPVSHFTPPHRDRPGAAGLLVANTECRIVDPATGESLGPDRDGELWIRGPQVMAGYLNQPAATAATLDAEGWLHTGDIAHVDADGYLYVVDRLKELIKYKGFQVPPAELEALLLAHPAVADAAVIGLPDDEAGEIPVAFVVLKPGQQADAAAIQAHVASQVAHYKQLRRVEFISAIPKSASGKILRRVLREKAIMA